MVGHSDNTWPHRSILTSQKRETDNMNLLIWCNRKCAHYIYRSLVKNSESEYNQDYILLPVYRKYKGERNMVNHTQGCNQQNPYCKKFYRTKKPVSSTNVLQDIKRWKGKLQVDLKHSHLLDPNYKKTSWKNLWCNWGTLNTDQIFGNIKELLLTFRCGNDVMVMLKKESVCCRDKYHMTCVCCLGFD